MTLAEFNRWIGYLTNVLAACLLARLVWFGLTRRYAFLAAYFLADILQTVLTIGASRSSLRYGYAYFGGQAAITLLAVAVSIQLWLAALRGYPALARFGRRIAIYMLLGALLLAAGGLWLKPSRSAAQNVFPHYFNAFEGSLDSMVVLFLAAATLFLLWFPLEVPRNVAVIIGGLSIYLLQRWAGLLLVNLYPKSVHGFSAAFLIVEAAILIFWIVAVRPAGERITTVTGHRWNPKEAERLLGQLDAINERLEQMAR